MTFIRTLVPAAAAMGIALGALMATPVLAQSGTAAPEAQTQINPSDSDIDAFVLAALEVSQVRDAYLERLQQTQSETEQQTIVEEANAAILQVVEDAAGITIDEYVAIGEAAMADPELSAEIDARFAALVDKME